MNGDHRHNVNVLARLADVIAARADGDAAQSYTARLLAAGPARCARKFGEEAVELVVASLADKPGAIRAEAADVLYHLLVLLRAGAVDLADVMNELEGRFARGGLAEKASRSGRTGKGGA